ncbi:MAG TPA: hypothetical protein VMW27_12655 [Thermoanaerobaculia bacterium]|nr:hypothetical protein [Thermoanaerobaculia bacterium]
MPEPMTATAEESRPLAVRASSDGRRTIACPKVTAGELRCWKLFNPDSDAAWDFWLMLILQSVGPIAKVTQLIPLPGGGYRQFETRTGHKNVESVTSLHTFESKSDGAGFVRLAKTEARKSYAELRGKLFAVTSKVRDFDAAGDPVSDAEITAAPPWPDLPGDGEVAALLRQFAPVDHPQPFAELGAVIHFPDVAATGDDYEVSDGEVLPAAVSAAPATAGRPAIRIEVFQREGVPAAIVNDFFLIDEAGRVRRLYGDRCAQKTHIRVLQVIREERDRGFFRSRHKLTEIRKRLRVDDLTWEET